MLIDKVNEKTSEFIKSRLSKQFHITSIKKDKELWNVKAEVFEESEFIQTIGIKTNAKDKNLYTFQLDDKLNIVGYEKIRN